MADTPPIADRIVQAAAEAINSHLCDCEEECRPQRNRDAAVAVLRELGHVHGDLDDLADEIEGGRE